MDARQMIEAVVRGYSPSQLVEAETVPPWSPGQPVPDGYKVVFGRLAKVGISGTPAHHERSTQAYNSSADAERQNRARAHWGAVSAHQDAELKHLLAARSTKDPAQASLHRAASDAHKQMAAYHLRKAKELPPD